MTPGSQLPIFQGPCLCRLHGVGGQGLAVNSQEVISLPTATALFCWLLGGFSHLSILALVLGDLVRLPVPGHRDGGEGLQ